MALHRRDWTGGTGRALLAWALALVAGGCGGGGAATRPTAPAGPLDTAGTRCTAPGVCTCRPVDDKGEATEQPNLHDPTDPEGAPRPGTKRFELRTGRGMDAIAIGVEGHGALQKQTDTPAPSCGYLDLPPGRHRVVFHATAAKPEEGMEPSFFIGEWSNGTRSWYHTFQFRCGGGEEVCSEPFMERWTGEHGKVARGLWDPCGSTKVEGLKWRSLRSVGPKLAELEVELTLHVYPFEPRFPHGAPRCKGQSAPAVQ